MIDDAKKRTIRSFVLRAGRMTEAQDKAYQSLWHEYGPVVNINGLIFERHLVGTLQFFEIGFSMGFLLSQALNEPIVILWVSRSISQVWGA